MNIISNLYQVYHKWTCDSETTDTFCAVVHSCTVDDGNGDTVQILNDEGCALDKFLLNNLEYPTDLMAGQEAHVYKYADRSQLFYQCQISITIKEPNTECPRPQCPEPQGFGAIKVDIWILFSYIFFHIDNLFHEKLIIKTNTMDINDKTLYSYASQLYIMNEF
uniref:ZP domain-containing protein n=1 Tax=Heterorhabditis bacteriophora TaxID=37862 RepID=A0A1I7X122_HETBA